MKTIFDVICDGASCYVPAWDPLGFFRCQMAPFHGYCGGRDYHVYGAGDKVLGQNLWLIACYRDVFCVINDDASYSLYRTDGKALGEHVDTFRLYEAKMVALFSAKKGVLMRYDGALIHQGAKMYEVAEDGKSFFALDGDGSWKLYTVDGKLVAENIQTFLMKSSDFYMLRFLDGSAFVYDAKNNSKFPVPVKAEISLLDYQMFELKQNGKAALYRADGTKLLDGARVYGVLSNGLVWENQYMKNDCLYGANLKPVLKHLNLACADGCGNLFRGDKDYVFDNNGRLVATYPYNTTLPVGSGYYLAWDGKKDVVVLHRPDTSVVRSNLVGAIVYPNDWKVVFSSQTEKSSKYPLPLCSLLDDKDNLIVDQAEVLAYLYYFGAYVYAKGGKYSLVNAKGKVVVKDADCIAVFGDVYVVERRGQVMEVRFLADIDA